MHATEKYEAVTSYQYKVSVTTYVLFSGKVKHPVTEMVRLVLAPLMGGESEQKERITEAFRIIEKTKDSAEEDIRRLEAVIYAMADKFLEKVDLDEIRKEMKMTELGRMIYEEAKTDLGEALYEEAKIELGKALYEEAEQKVKTDLARKLLGILSDDLIAEKTGLPIEVVLKLKEEKESGSQTKI